MGSFSTLFDVIASKTRLVCANMEAGLQLEDFMSVNHNKSTESSLRREPYPLIEPYSSGNLKVSETHTLYWEQNGNPDGYVSLSILQLIEVKTLHLFMSKAYKRKVFVC